MTRFSFGQCRVLRMIAIACLTTAAAATASAASALTAADQSSERAANAPPVGNALPNDLNIWVYPVIRGYGGVRPRPDLPSGMTPAADYRVIADVVHGESGHTHVLGSLERLARLVNLMSYAGIPPDHVHVVAVIEGAAGFAVLTDAAYRKRFNADNPNLALLHALKRAGVELMVCAQALAENDFQDRDISPDVTVTLSALTDFVLYGQRGYAYLQL